MQQKRQHSSVGIRSRHNSVVVYSDIVTAAGINDARNVDCIQFRYRRMERRWSRAARSSASNARYEFVLNKKFLFVQNKSVYEPQEKNPHGEIHEDRGWISYDRARESYVFRQFHIEGFVNQYVLDQIAEAGQSISFVTEEIENISSVFTQNRKLWK
jgi:hypothetical protein